MECKVKRISGNYKLTQNFVRQVNQDLFRYPNLKT